MNRQEFENRKAADWANLELRVQGLEGKHAGVEPEKIPGMFRRVCHDLSLAQYRMYGSRICDRLNSLAMRSYRLIHSSKGGLGEGMIRFIFNTFPNALRREWKLFVVSSLLFWVPFFLMWWSASQEIAWVQATLGPEAMMGLEDSYGKSDEGFIEERQEPGANFLMFAHYIRNNVGIDFKLFAGGILFGVGTIFFQVFNGIYIGAAFGYVSYAGDQEKLLSFVAGHSSFELLGMIVVGMAGLKIGFSMLSPGRLSRTQALTKAGRGALPLLIGGASMTALAAVVEGFWSAQPVPYNTKYAVGVFFWVAHLAYFLFVGRRFRGA
ncbi:stage II sporulation protein M [Akkermansiaceae bacterium]|nr:stage II sporulation protein M [Akkermansiaceae bacterium]MDB4452062.1 stage II sporulation protein M [Akkermansiaceae bacterium]MDB4532507.1 stage II sporulation protein M [bacterium]MDC1206519.1 stage II sporulation protein M [Akkermansiaceae bacterium]